MPIEEARRLMELNFFALLEMTQLVVPHMRARRSGTIVNIGSIGGKMVLPWSTMYSASKYAVGALTEGLRMELRRDGVHAMLVCPGYVKTGFQEHVYGGRVPPDVLRSRRYAVTAGECAAAIRRGVERDARTVLTPRAGWILVALARLFPAIVQSRMAGMNESA
jgi:short-subunit dehydrogenase